MNTTILISLALNIVTVLLVVFILHSFKNRNLKDKNDKSKFRQFVEHVVLNSKEISDKFTSNSKHGIHGIAKNQLQTFENKLNEFQKKLNENNVKMFEDKLQKMERQFGDLQEKVNKLSKLSDAETKTEIVENLLPANEDIKYFRSKQGNFFFEEVFNESEGKFKVFDINGNEGKFEYYGGVVNSDFFIDICSFENNPSEVPNKTKIRTIIPGVVKKDNNSNWEVFTPAKIKFE